jgi:ribosomal protein L37AE/L43A
MSRYRETGKGTIRYGDPLLCQQCVSRLRSELLEVDTMAAVLVAQADGHRSSTGSDSAIRAHRNAGTRASASPAHDLLDELTSLLREYVTAKRQAASRLGLVARDLSELCSWLYANADKYVYDPAMAGKLAADVHSWHGRLERRTKSATALLHKPVPCPQCKRQALVQERGSDVVRCSECGLIRSISDYEALAADAAEQADGGAGDVAPKTRRKSAAPSS